MPAAFMSGAHMTARQRNEMRLVVLGWIRQPDGRWRNPETKLKWTTYDTVTAIGMEQLRDRIRSKGHAFAIK